MGGSFWYLVFKPRSAPEAPLFVCLLLFFVGGGAVDLNFLQCKIPVIFMKALPLARFEIPISYHGIISQEVTLISKLVEVLGPMIIDFEVA